MNKSFEKRMKKENKDVGESIGWINVFHVIIFSFVSSLLFTLSLLMMWSMIFIELTLHDLGIVAVLSFFFFAFGIITFLFGIKITENE